MSASPFSTYDEFYSATGPIYTLADRPALIGILTVLSAGIFIYFIYATYTMNKGGDEGASMKGMLGVLLAASVLPLADAVYSQYIQRSDHRPTAAVPQESEPNEESPSTGLEPLALLGTMSLGSSALGRGRRDGRLKTRRKVKRVSR
ncbi:MAG: hypothetical protein WBA57_15605 [Elainellaceae cyanobacterium]